MPILRSAIDPTAIVHPAADLGEGVEIGPYAIVEAHARLGDRTRLGASAFVAAGSIIGPDCEVYTGAVVGGAAQSRSPAGAAGGLRIGARTVIREHVTIHHAQAAHEDTIVGSDVLLMAGSHVAHGCRIGDGATIANNALLAGSVVVGDRCFISGNVGVHQHVRIGTLSMISGQSRVSKDVLPFVVVVGNSEVRGLNVVGMRRAGMSPPQRQNVRRAYAVMYRSGLNVTQALERLRAMPTNDEIDAWLDFARCSTRGLCRARRRDR